MKQHNYSMDHLPWDRLYRFLLNCSEHHDLSEFSNSILNGLGEFIAFDRGLVYFLDGNQQIFNQYLMNIKDSWSRMYLDYYSKTSFNSFSIDRKDIREIPGQPYIHIIQWNKEPVTNFISDYIKAQNLQNSLAFVLFDLNGIPRTAFALDRLTPTDFSEEEVNLLHVILPLLNNLHKNFYARPIGETDFKDSIWASAGLTDREIEVVNLLCQGISPSNISKALHIAVSTTYKHVAHIYEKMGVSTLQGLLVKVLNTTKKPT